MQRGSAVSRVCPSLNIQYPTLNIQHPSGMANDGCRILIFASNPMSGEFPILLTILQSAFCTRLAPLPLLPPLYLSLTPLTAPSIKLYAAFNDSPSGSKSPDGVEAIPRAATFSYLNISVKAAANSRLVGPSATVNP